MRRKRAWDRLVADLDVDLEVVHRNELPDWARDTVDRAGLPTVLVRRGDGTVEQLLDPAALAGCDGSVEAFRDRLERALTPDTS